MMIAIIIIPILIPLATMQCLHVIPIDELVILHSKRGAWRMGGDLARAIINTNLMSATYATGENPGALATRKKGGCEATAANV